jgi:hypothetical protein
MHVSDRGHVSSNLGVQRIFQTRFFRTGILRYSIDFSAGCAIGCVRCLVLRLNVRKSRDPFVGLPCTFKDRPSFQSHEVDMPGDPTVETWTLYALGVSITVLRTYARVSTVGYRGLHADDYLIWLAIVRRFASFPAYYSQLTRFVRSSTQLKQLSGIKLGLLLAVLLTMA